jgi:Raf kinase inhibitor-like YbhB/YbcL family protein
VAIDLNRPVAPDPYSILPKVKKFLLTSDDVTDGQPLALAQTAEGGNASPHLAWSDFPSETQSFLLTCYDPDAPSEGGFWHWLVADIPLEVTSIEAGTPSSAGVATVMVKAVASRFFRPTSSTGVPEAVDLPNSIGSAGFIGAAPPKGDRIHRYFFAIHALDVAKLELPHGRRTAPDLVAATAVPHTIARAVLLGTHQR